MIKLAAQVVPVKLNAGKEGRELAKKYGIQGLPTILFINAKGDIQQRITGYLDAKAFAAKLDGLGGGEILAARSQANSKPDDGEAHARLGLALSIAGKPQEAEQALLKARKTRYSGPLIGQGYNNLGDHYAQGGQLDQAVEAFQSADRSGKDAAVRAYAKLRLAEVYAAKGDKDRARKTAQAVLDLKGAPIQFVEKARELAK